MTKFRFTLLRQASLSLKRYLHSTFEKPIREVSIPVPWGKIAGKFWGSTATKPILCLHGIQDNCGSFDRLISFLRKDEDISFLAIDFPGHGYSSPYPRGSIYDFYSYPLIVQQVCDYFNWTTVSLMGHSLGAMTSFSYTVMYPERVNFLICIDSLQPIQTIVTAESLRRNMDRYFKYDSYNRMDIEPLAYTMEEVIQKLAGAHKNSINPKYVKYLMERNIAASKKFPGKYYFTRHPMLKLRFINSWSQEQIIKDTSHLTHPIFVCKAAQSSYYQPKENYYDVLNELKKHSKDCDFHIINGTHHLHLNEPENIGSHIKSFLKKHYNAEICKLDTSLFCGTRSNRFEIDYSGEDLHTA